MAQINLSRCAVRMLLSLLGQTCHIEQPWRDREKHSGLDCVSRKRWIPAVGMMAILESTPYIPIYNTYLANCKREVRTYFQGCIYYCKSTCCMLSITCKVACINKSILYFTVILYIGTYLYPYPIPTIPAVTVI